VKSALGERCYPYALGILRIVIGFTFWQHGLSKFGFIEGRVREFPELTWFAGVLEIVGGLLIALGVFTKPLAFLLSGQMAAAYFLSHAPQGFWPLLNGGEPAVMYCFMFLFLAVAGGGKFSVDAWMEKKIGARVWL
jgi:putative oxidoreductase